MLPDRPLVIATRESALALWQARHVRDRLMALHPGLEVELLGMTTQGDRILDVTLNKIGGKGCSSRNSNRHCRTAVPTSPCIR